MAVVTAAIDWKLVFRQALIGLRYVVAAAVTVVIIMTTVYAFVVVARTDDLYINVVDSYISVEPEPPHPKLSFTLSAYNPSGRVHFYYTGIRCVLKVNNSRIDPAYFGIPDMVVAPDSVQQLQIGKEENITSDTMLIQEFRKNSSIQFSANLTLNGSLTVGVYSVYNKTSVPTTYYCTSVVVGNVNVPVTGSWSASCLTNEDKSAVSLSAGRALLS